MSDYHFITQWMIRLAPLLRPLFAWNYDKVMEERRKRLARRLNTPVVKI